jgi:hypothetical protein
LTRATDDGHSRSAMLVRNSGVSADSILTVTLVTLRS